MAAAANASADDLMATLQLIQEAIGYFDYGDEGCPALAIKTYLLWNSDGPDSRTVRSFQRVLKFGLASGYIKRPKGFEDQRGLLGTFLLGNPVATVLCTTPVNNKSGTPAPAKEATLLPASSNNKKVGGSFKEQSGPKPQLSPKPGNGCGATKKAATPTPIKSTPTSSRLQSGHQKASTDAMAPALLPTALTNNKSLAIRSVAQDDSKISPRAKISTVPAVNGTSKANVVKLTAASARTALRRSVSIAEIIISEPRQPPKSPLPVVGTPVINIEGNCRSANKQQSKPDGVTTSTPVSSRCGSPFLQHSASVRYNNSPKPGSGVKFSVKHFDARTFYRNPKLALGPDSIRQAGVARTPSLKRRAN